MHRVRQVRLMLIVLASAAFINWPVRGAGADPAPREAGQIIREAIEYWRDKSSFAEAEMTIHRPDWTRTSELKAWTSGSNSSLVRFTAPSKDAGNATLTVNDDVWTFSPKTNRTVKVPPSMKSQSWMGSDFSYQDLSKDDEIVESYSHRLAGEEQHDGKRVYIIESTPFEAAPIVWGKEVVYVREDLIIIRHLFFDQEDRLIKELRASEIALLGGKLYATVVRMTKADAPDDWTEVRYRSAQFGVPMAPSTFTLSNLSAGRR